MKKKMLHFFGSTGGIFLLGGIIGALFFGTLFGFSIVNPTYTSWIFNEVTHDTAQHFLGWEFFRADSTGAIINGLAYPVGLPITFMDGIPLFALPLKLIVGVLPASFQYFGLWGLICYVLQGGIAAILVRKVWRKVYKDSEKASIWQILFVAAGALIFVLSPMMIARSLYHPALAAQWLVLLGILLVWDAPKIISLPRFIAIWSAMLVGAVLIHPYFLPMLGVMTVVAGLRNLDCHSKSSKKNIVALFIKILIPVALAGLVFMVIGGFALGSGAEIRDLEDKGFNLLSFMISGGYSLTPSLPQRSYSPETMMWFGLGVWSMLIATAFLWISKYRKSFRNFRTTFTKNKLRNILIAIVAVGLLIFAIGTRVDFGPIALFQYSVPDKIYQLWSAFRAAAREAWAFYYAAILTVIYWFIKAISELYKEHALKFATCQPTEILKRVQDDNSETQSSSRRHGIFAITALLICAATAIQFADIWFSPKATARREGFSKIQNIKQPEYIAPQISDLVITQKHLTILDKNFRRDQSGFYELGQATLQNNLTMNIGFFARVPEQIFTEQEIWREKVINGNLTDDDLRDNIFVTTDEDLIQKLADSEYNITKREKFYFITRGEK
ncbi:MAG: DUF6311 domain-containing protein [Candidatus Nomurabacteria bacterium]|jgi:hypothetical protein|nr:DUF6311 domain-containing protein [Candidatus Nomurabacteria bacterium]